ncbi:CcoQ/FixQ family Cbb3-type cytochrome c oxidase assembly chaperone [Roseateles aquatilis]|uniref:CcoQ/FixQ family Cbb3-type cytochrome c oxidase assembly chaperone n=1 Tax=Roseateles aquatilis TaxID=431061 RepID=A0A246JG15_9BURK|nr:cbb3-type cytochrome c oxidase subunit 3 [Roseateles aquatilis]OWQ91549.1 CcoQ/FixQ family Cbb3-type cytochrome c oxidase assembly chaperone [Roseateles aquatilis]
MGAIDLNTLRSAVTLLSLLVFLGIVVWAYARRNRERFEDLGALPLMDEPATPEGARHE